MRLLRRGSRGPDVRQFQTFLLGLDYYRGEVHGRFDAATDRAVRAWQKVAAIGVDGVVGDESWGAALLDGLALVEWPLKALVKHGPNWPLPPDGMKPLGQAGRERVFGHLAFKPNPTEGNPEGIAVASSWRKDNLVRVTIPQLRGVKGAPKSGRVFVHRLAAEPLVRLFEVWEQKFMLAYLKTWAGSWCPRFVRGSRRYLSNHAYGTAFDINATWNGLGRRPAKLGVNGSVRELVTTANGLGWFWGGHYTKRPDGMHFELVNPDAHKLGL